MNFPFHGMTDEEKAEITPYIQKFIDNCGGDITIYCAYNLNEEMFAVNFSRPTDEFVGFKWIYRGEEGKRKADERFNREMAEDDDDE